MSTEFHSGIIDLSSDSVKIKAEFIEEDLFTPKISAPEIFIPTIKEILRRAEVTSLVDVNNILVNAFPDIADDEIQKSAYSILANAHYRLDRLWENVISQEGSGSEKALRLNRTICEVGYCCRLIEGVNNQKEDPRNRYGAGNRVSIGQLPDGRLEIYFSPWMFRGLMKCSDDLRKQEQISEISLTLKEQLAESNSENNEAFIEWIENLQDPFVDEIISFNTQTKNKIIEILSMTHNNPGKIKSLIEQSDLTAEFEYLRAIAPASSLATKIM